jgi:hypothetical protein
MAHARLGTFRGQFLHDAVGGIDKVIGDAAD